MESVQGVVFIRPFLRETRELAKADSGVWVVDVTGLWRCRITTSNGHEELEAASLEARDVWAVTGRLRRG